MILVYGSQDAGKATLSRHPIHQLLNSSPELTIWNVTWDRQNLPLPVAFLDLILQNQF